MRMKQLAVAIALIGAGAAINAQAEEKVNKVERVEVTGSSIKRVKKEGTTPIETVNRKAIEKTGATSVNELMKNLSVIDTFDQGEQTSNSPSGSGSSTVKMHGLSETDVLVLLNGRRLPSNAMQDASGAGSAVDVNLIPVSAIERVEILKDGGSAVYGADAAGGVINFITKKNYQGGEVRASLGQSSRGDGTEKNFGMSGGYGDLEEQGFNVFASFDVFKREAIMRKDRELSESIDFRRFGGKDGRSSFSPSGNKLDKDFNLTGETVSPCPASNLSKKICRYDFNSSILTAYNGADRLSGMLLGNLKINDNISAFVQGFYASNKDHFEAHPAPDVLDLPGSTDADPKRFRGRFMQGGPRTTDRDASLAQVVVGLDGSFKGFDWSAAAGYGVGKADNQDSNYLDKNKFKAAVKNGLIDATVTTNNQALVDSLKVTPNRVAESVRSFLDAKVSGETGIDLPGGALAFAVGVAVNRESLKDTPDALQQVGGVFGSIQQSAVDASRTGKAVFGELAIPVLKSLELQGALRYDSYESESKVSPRIAARFQPIPELMFRTSYSESFRMPTLKQLHGNTEEGAYTFQGGDCAFIGMADDCRVDGNTQTQTNSTLKPEKGQSFNLGVVADLGPFSGSIDWWKNEKSDVIVKADEVESLKKGRLKYDTRGPIVFAALENRSTLENEGIDTDLRFRLPTDIATFTFANSNTYFLKQKQSNADGVLWDYSGIYSTGGATPKWRNTFRVDAEKAGWAGSIALRTTAGFDDTRYSPDDKENYDPNVQVIPNHTEMDLMFSYSGIKNLKVDFAIKNALDRMPPFSNENVNSDRSQIGAAEIYSIRGRFFSLGAKYAF